MIELKNLSFSYTAKSRPALSGITASIPEGIHLLAGENGAGKTTLLHIIAGLCTPTSGECTISGISSTTDIAEEKGNVFLVEENMHFPYKTIRIFSSLHSKFYPTFSQEVFLSNLLSFGLTGDEQMKSLSLGNRKKSQLAYALALGVDVLLLDEPTNGLDIQSKQILRRLIADSASDGKTIIISTHNFGELENLFDGATLLTKSNLLFSASEEEISDRLNFSVTRIQDPEAIYSEIQIGRVLNISAAEAGEEPTRVDWRLLYNSMYSPQRKLIIELMNKTIE